VAGETTDREATTCPCAAPRIEAATTLLANAHEKNRHVISKPMISSCTYISTPQFDAKNGRKVVISPGKICAATTNHPL
jgi:hypothetical protein